MDHKLLPTSYYQVPQAKPRTDRDMELVQAKIIPVRRRGYIGPGPVDSLIHYFYVPKGLDDVRIVYNGTGCGLNKAIWANAEKAIRGTC